MAFYDIGKLHQGGISDTPYEPASGSAQEIEGLDYSTEQGVVKLNYGLEEIDIPDSGNRRARYLTNLEDDLLLIYTKEHGPPPKNWSYDGNNIAKITNPLGITDFFLGGVVWHNVVQTTKATAVQGQENYAGNGDDVVSTIYYDFSVFVSAIYLGYEDSIEIRVTPYEVPQGSGQPVITPEGGQQVRESVLKNIKFDDIKNCPVHFYLFREENNSQILFFVVGNRVRALVFRKNTAVVNDRSVLTYKQLVENPRRVFNAQTNPLIWVNSGEYVLFSDFELDLPSDYFVTGMIELRGSLIISTRNIFNKSAKLFIYSLQKKQLRDIGLENVYIRGFFGGTNGVYFNLGEKGDLYSFDGNVYQKEFSVFGDKKLQKLEGCERISSFVGGGRWLYGLSFEGGKKSGIYSINKYNKNYRRSIALDYSFEEYAENFDSYYIEDIEYFKGNLYFLISFEKNGNIINKLFKVDKTKRLKQGHFTTQEYVFKILSKGTPNILRLFVRNLPTVEDLLVYQISDGVLEENPLKLKVERFQGKEQGRIVSVSCTEFKPCSRIAFKIVLLNKKESLDGPELLNGVFMT